MMYGWMIVWLPKAVGKGKFRAANETGLCSKAPSRPQIQDQLLASFN